MADNTTKVFYEAIANFTQAKQAVRSMRKEVEALQRAEAKQNAASIANDKKASQASLALQRAERKQAAEAAAGSTKKVQANKAEKASVDLATMSVKDYIAAKKAEKSATDASTSSTQKSTMTVRDHAAAVLADAAEQRKADAISAKLSATNKKAAESTHKLGEETKKAANEAGKAGPKFGRLSNFLKGVIRDSKNADTAMGKVSRGAANIQRGFQKLGNWRPRLTPPFIAIVPAIAAVVASINPLISLLGAAGGAAIGFASSLGSVAGAALALPGILASVAGGVAALVSAFGGIGGAFRAFSQLRQGGAGGGGGGGGGGGDAAKNQARDIVRAQQDIEDAQVDLARAYEDSAERISDAETSYRKAQQASLRAQEALNEARVQALRDLQDLRKEVERGTLNEERAIANLAQAQEAYNNAMADPGSSAADKLSAAADVKEAENDLVDVREQNIRNQEELTKAEKKGVEGSDQVVDARESVADALEEESDAYRELSRARQDEAKTIRDAIRAVEDSYDALAKAQEGAAGGGGGGGGGFDALQAALDKLSPSARAVVLALMDMADEWDAMNLGVQEAFFSQIVGDMGKLRSLIPIVGQMLTPIATALGNIAHNLIDMLSSDSWKTDLVQFGTDAGKLFDSAGKGALALLDAMRHLIMAAAPFTQWLVDSLSKGAENFRDLVKSGRESGEIAKYLERVQKRLETWFEIVKNIAGTLINYGSAASEFGDWITEGLRQITEGWLEASRAAKEEDSPFKQWLEDIKPLLSELKSLFSTFFGWFAEQSADEDNIKQATEMVRILREDLGPAIGDLLDTLSETGIGTDLLNTLTSIIESIDSIMKAGGGEGFKSFLETVEGFFGAVADLLNALPKDMLAPLLSFFGTLAGLAFIGKFTGITSLVGSLMGLAGKEGLLSKIVTGLGGLNKLKFGGLISGLGKLAGPIGIVLTIIEQIGHLWGALDKPIDKLANGEYQETAKKEGAPAAIRDLNSDVTEGGDAAKVMVPIAGIVSGVLGVINPELQKGFDQWLEDTSEAFLNWVTIDLPGWLGELAGGFVSTVQDIFDNIGKAWETAGQWIQDNIFTPIGDAWNTVTAFVQDNIFTPIGDAWNTLTAFIQDNIFQPIADAWNTVTSFVRDNIFLPVYEAFIEIVGIIQTEIFEPIGRAWAKVTAWVQTNVFDPIAKAFNDTILWIQTNIFQPIADGFNAAILWIQTNIFQPIADAFNATILWIQTNIFQPIIDGFNNVIAWIQANVFQPIADAWNAAVLWIQENVFQPIADAFNTAVAFINTVFQTINDAFNTIISWIQTNVFQPIADAWNTIAAFVQSVFDGFNAFVGPGGTLSTWFNDLISNFKTVVGNLPGAFQQAIDTIKDIFRGIGSFFNGVVGFVRDTFNNIGSWFGDVVNNAKNVWNNVQSWFQDVVNGARNVWTNIENAWNNFVNGIGNIGTQVYNAISNAFSGVLSTISSALSFFGIGGAVKEGKAKKTAARTAAAAKPAPAASAPSRATAGGRPVGRYQTGGHVAYLAKGGRPPAALKNFFKPKGTDTVPAMLTPGEFVLRKRIVDAIGVQNLNMLNNGMKSYADLVGDYATHKQLDPALTQKQPSSMPEEGKRNKTRGGTVLLASGGTVPGGSAMSSLVNTASAATSQTFDQSKSTSIVDDDSIKIDNLELNVYNAVPEPSSESLPKSIRRLTSLKKAPGVDE